MPENGERVVVASGRCLFRISSRPLFAVGLRDLAHLGFIQSWPTFEKRGENLPPVIARSRFDPQIVIEISDMNGSGVAKGHFRQSFAIGVFPALPMILEEFGELRFGHAEM